MTIILVLNLLSIAAATASAAGWFYAATAPRWEPMAWLSGPPQWVVDSINRSSAGNCFGAIFAALTVLFQAAATAYSAWQA